MSPDIHLHRKLALDMDKVVDLPFVRGRVHKSENDIISSRKYKLCKSRLIQPVHFN